MCRWLLSQKLPFSWAWAIQGGASNQKVLRASSLWEAGCICPSFVESRALFCYALASDLEPLRPVFCVCFPILEVIFSVCFSDPGFGELFGVILVPMGLKIDPCENHYKSLPKQFECYIFTQKAYTD